jgi:hypothetical protein
VPRAQGTGKSRSLRYAAACGRDFGRDDNLKTKPQILRLPFDSLRSLRVAQDDSGLSEALGFFEGGGDGDERVDAGEAEELDDTVVGRDDDEAAAVLLAVDVEVDQLAHAGRIHVRGLGEIDDGERSFFAAELLAEGEDGLQGERATECEDACASGRSLSLYAQWIVLHTGESVRNRLVKFDYRGMNKGVPEEARCTSIPLDCF